MKDIKNTKQFNYLAQLSQLTPVFQPIVEISSEKIIGYEALIRSKTEKISPQKLFQHSYAEGFTIPLDVECMKQAFRFLPKLKKNQRLFVNVEPVTLNTCFTKHSEVYRLLERTEKTDQIVFELTEGLKTWDLELAKKGVKGFRQFKCKLALDDMKGIGLKLFEMLTLKPEFIKIDMSLIKNLTKQPMQQSIVEQLVQLGKKYNSEVIAEGVETLKELKLISKMHVRYAQGFYFARPQALLS